MKKKLKIIITVLIVFIISLIISMKLLFNSSKILINFEILSLTNVYTDYKVKFAKVKAADHYVIQIHDKDNRKVFELTTKNTEEKLSLTNLINNEEYSLMVYAYDKLGDYRPCEKEYKFIYDEPSFEITSILLNNEDYDLLINGDINAHEYHLVILKNDELLSDNIIKENDYLITKDNYLDSEVHLNIKLMCEKTIIDEVDLYNNLNPVSDINIVKPVSEQVIPFNDVTFTFNGGDNAEYYEIKIYKDKKCIKTSKTKKHTVILSKNLFEVGGFYRIDLMGVYGDYNKSASINFSMSEQAQLSPVYISHNWKYVKKGTKIELKNNDENAKIYYTLNGDNPESHGHLYTEPIEINENVMIRCVAVLEGKINSVISSYEINVGEKTNLKVYLSPSNQHGNIGISKVGYTNEMDEMNDLTNYIEERLKSYGVKVYRNNPAGNINLWNKDSNYYGVDLKIAIHSNASNLHDTYGIETWIDTENSLTYSIANKIQNGLISIYPYADLEDANRGVKYANGSLGEANDLYAPFQLLVEVAHHDYEDDAKWIMENKKLIGYNIADSILEYYQIID